MFSSEMFFSEKSSSSVCANGSSVFGEDQLSMSSKNILVICGGQSPEHQVSLVSAQYIAQNIHEKHKVFAVVIDQNGEWIQVDPCRIASSFEEKKKAQNYAFLRRKNASVLFEAAQQTAVSIDIVFPVLHGPLGEDGTIQGMLQFLGVPFVGCDMRSSLMGMDKRLSKEFLSHHGIPVAPFVAVHDDQDIPGFEELCEKLGSSSLFIKPSNSGSSIGVFHARNSKQYEEDIRRAFEYDRVVLVEKRIQGQEVECAVLGDTFSPQASRLGEIRVEDDFYSYEAKYLGMRKVDIVIPAALSSHLTVQIQKLACQVFQLLGCSGMARVDFFVENDQIFVNEINTIPGFTPISLYPQLWKEEGVESKALVQKLIEIGFLQFERQQKLVHQFARVAIS